MIKFIVMIKHIIMITTMIMIISQIKIAIMNPMIMMMTEGMSAGVWDFW